MPDGLERRPPDPTEPGLDGFIPVSGGVGALLAAADAVFCWLTPKPRPRRFVRVPDLRGMTMSKAWWPAHEAGVKLRVHRLVERPAPVDGLVVDQHPAPGTRVRRDSVVVLDVLHDEDARSTLST